MLELSNRLWLLNKRASMDEWIAPAVQERKKLTAHVQEATTVGLVWGCTSFSCNLYQTTTYTPYTSWSLLGYVLKRINGSRAERHRWREHSNRLNLEAHWWRLPSIEASKTVLKCRKTASKHISLKSRSLPKDSWQFIPWHCWKIRDVHLEFGMPVHFKIRATLSLSGFAEATQWLVTSIPWETKIWRMIPLYLEEEIWD